MIELNVALGDYQGEARRVAEFEGDSLRRTNVRQLAPKTIRPGRLALSLWTISPQSLDD